MVQANPNIPTRIFVTGNFHYHRQTFKQSLKLQYLVLRINCSTTGTYLDKSSSQFITEQYQAGNPQAGIRLFIHRPNTTVSDRTTAVSVAPGLFAYVSMSITEVSQECAKLIIYFIRHI